MHYKEDCIETRAQIFQPFETLKGLKEMLKKQERIIVPKRELMDDELEILNHKIHKVIPNMMVKVEYYDGKDYIRVNGMVSKIDLENRFIQIVKKRINLDQIDWIELEIE